MPFEPGKSGNPGGRPKRDKSITQHLIAELGEIDPNTGGEKVRRVVIALIEKAMAGDIPAVREIMDRVEGKVATILGNDLESPLIPSPAEDSNSTKKWLEDHLERVAEKQKAEETAISKWMQENPQATAAQYVEQVKKIANATGARAGG